MTAIIIAAFGDIARVDTTVAIALGASVQPLTKITNETKITTTSKIGLSTARLKKSNNSIIS
jgi:hypothetical protein